MGKINVVEHPLLKNSLTIIRSKETAINEFRRHTAIVSQIIITEATKQIPLREKEIETPLNQMLGHELKTPIVFVPVLRAGISMLFPAINFISPSAVGFIGLERDEQTAIAHEYYQKFPKNLDAGIVIVLDPMLATGGSISDTISALKRKGANTIVVACIVSAPEGLEVLQKRHPDVNIFTAAIDSHLNESKYIVPGLGDYGDRYFGTQ